MATKLLKYEPSKLSRLEQYEREEKARHEIRLRRARLIQTLSFVGVLFVFGVLSLTLPKPAESEVEKRRLAAMPEFSLEVLVEGSYVKGVELHYADTFPFRDGFVSIASLIDELRGIRFDGVRIYAQKPAAEPPPVFKPPEPDFSSDPPITEAPSENSQSNPEEQAPPAEASSPHKPHVVEDDGAIGEQSGAVFVYKEKAMSIFGGTNEMGKWYADVINAYDDAWGDRVQVYNIVVPTAIEFALPERYKSVTAPQKPNIDFIAECLNDSVIAVDVYSAIEDHADEYVYFNADHHWTALGAYYAYAAFARSAGITPLTPDQYEKKTIEDFKGTMYSYTTDARLKEDFVDYYIPDINYSAVRYDKNAPYTAHPHTVWAEYASGVNSYSVFLAGDFPLVKIDTEIKNGRRALVVKESFGNAFAPFLISHFEQVYVVDQRYFQLGLVDYVNQNGITDVIFINNAIAANTGIRIREISDMMYQQYVPESQAVSQPASSAPEAAPAESAAPQPQGMEPGSSQRQG